MSSYVRPLVIGLLSWMAALLVLAPSARASALVTTDQVRAELVVHAPEGLRPGTPAWLGLKIVHKKGWHTYWLNPGDSGLPTQLQWTLPPGLKAGEIDWPVPHRLPIGPLMNHGYEGTLLLQVPLVVEQPLPEQTLTIGLRADWLVCEDVCIPEGGDFTLKLPAGSARAALVRHAALFEETRAQLPVVWPGARATAKVDAQGLQLELSGLPAAWQGRKLSIFPTAPHVLSPSVEPQARWGAAGSWSGVMAFSPQRMDQPRDMGFVVALAEPLPKGVAPPGLALTAAVAGTWPPADAGAPAPGAGGLPAGSVSEGTGTRAAGGLGGAQAPAASGWWAALALAFIGGLILNLMPCVFPVLSLKVFGFASHAHDRRALAVGGAAYTLGVVLSFTALAGLLLALRASGEQLGWGFQLQSPPFVAALALLFTLMGLNLLGLFEFDLMVPGSWAAARANNPMVDHFLTGVLAVLVASPCTAPFMGASLGVAMTMPTPMALGVFVALGLGMASPYLLLCLMPAWAQKLPRPGAWMAKVKHALALPLLATVVWLVWVLGHQAGIDAAAGLLAFLLVLAFAIGAWGWAATSGHTPRLLARAASTAVVVGGMAWTLPLLQDKPPSSGLGAPAPSVASAGQAWAPWSPQAMADAMAQGQTVFVDYTAAWCVTCQVNKRSTLRHPEVEQALQARGIVTLLADWTRRDEAITRELSRLGRSGVPVYAFYRSGQDPVLLAEVLTPALMLQALEALPR
ncbi:MAG: protein-disulfide reductase DsbD family protein [Betaproteobacteria bacterium]